MTPAFGYTLIPVAATILGAAIAAARPPGPMVSSGLQHLAAGVLFAAIAGEILPDLKHQQSPFAVLVGGALGVAAMLAIKTIGERAKGPVGLVAVLAVDILIDGLVLGISLAAGAKAGLVITIALTLEVLFLGLSVTAELVEKIGSALKVVAIIAGLSLLLPVGAALGGRSADCRRPISRASSRLASSRCFIS